MSVVVINKVKHGANTQLTSSVHGKFSVRAISWQTGISHESVRWSLKIVFERYSYKIQHVQEQNSTNFITCNEFAKWVCERMYNDADWLSKVLWQKCFPHFNTWKTTHKIVCYGQKKTVRHWWKSPSWLKYESVMRNYRFFHHWSFLIRGNFWWYIAKKFPKQIISETTRYAALLKDKFTSHF